MFIELKLKSLKCEVFLIHLICTIVWQENVLTCTTIKTLDFIKLKPQCWLLGCGHKHFSKLNSSLKLNGPLYFGVKRSIKRSNVQLTFCATLRSYLICAVILYYFTILLRNLHIILTLTRLLECIIIRSLYNRLADNQKSFEFSS